MNRNKNRKELPTAAIANELRQSSVYFARPEISGPAQPAQDSDSSSMKQAGPPRNTKTHTEPTSSPPQTKVRSNEGTMERRTERSNEGTIVRAVQRKKMRHTFDIFQDQLSSLRRIQLEREEAFGERHLLGDLVQEALDLWISKERSHD